MKHQTLLVLLSMLSAVVVAACGGSGSKSAPPTSQARSQVDVTAGQATPAPATAVPLADFCSRVPPSDIEALAGPGAAALTGNSATVVAGPPLGPATPAAGALARCEYRSDSALLVVVDASLERYATATAKTLAQAYSVMQPVSDVGTEAMVFVPVGQPFSIDGRTYAGQVLFFAKNDSHGVSINIVTAGSPPNVDIELLKTLARTLLQA